MRVGSDHEVNRRAARHARQQREGGGVIRMRHGGWAARRRTQHPGRTKPRARQGVEEARLSGSGRPHDHDHQRRVYVGRPGQHVILDVAPQPLGVGLEVA